MNATQTTNPGAESMTKLTTTRQAPGFYTGTTTSTIDGKTVTVDFQISCNDMAAKNDRWGAHAWTGNLEITNNDECFATKRDCVSWLGNVMAHGWVAVLGLGICSR